MKNEERNLQMFVFDLLRFHGIDGLIAFHPFNEAKRAVRSKGFYQRLGMYPGIADVVLVHPLKGIVFFIELKSPTGRLSTDQRKFQDECLKYAHYHEVASTAEQAANILDCWGMLKSNPLGKTNVSRAI